jgi:hypothetical protein
MLRTLGVVLLLAAPSFAELCPTDIPALQNVDAETRIQFLRAGMKRSAHKSRVWAWSSAGVLSAVLQFQIMAAANSPKRGDQIDLAVGAVATAFSIGQIAAVPPLVMFDQFKLEKLAKHSRDRCFVLREAERWLIRDAHSEELGTGPGMHAAAMLFNIGIGAVFFAFDRYDSAAINVLLGAALSELQILTQPTDSVKLLERYRAGDLSLRKGEKLLPVIVPTARRDGAGLMLALPF